MMTIVYISSEYPPLTGNGGIGTYTKHIAEGMCRRGHEVHVISRSVTAERSDETSNGVTVHRVSPDPFMLPQGRHFYYVRAFMRCFFYHTLVRLSWASAAAGELDRLKKNLRKIDIVEYPECGAEGFFVRKTPGTLKVVRLHTPWYIVRKINTIRERPGDHVLFKHLEINAIRKADLITAPSNAVVSLIRKHIGRPAHFIVPNPVDVHERTGKQGHKWIFTGRVERRKGVHILLAAYISVCQNHQPPELILLGAPFGIDSDGIPYEDKIEQQIKESSFSGKIHWIKGVSHDEVGKYLSQSEAAFFPSIWENLAYACLEAMAAGCTVVASDCGGFREMISNGTNGFLVEPGNIRKWSDTMISLLNDPESVKKTGAAAAADVKNNYNIDTICMKNERFLTEKISGK